MDRDVAGMLRCLHCKGRLVADDNGSGLRCASCGRCWPIVHGIPVVIDDERSVFRVKQFVDAVDTTYRSPSAKILSVLFRFLPPADVNVASKKNYRELARRLGPQATVLVVGGGVDGCGFEALRRRTDLTIVSTDVAFQEATDVICDGHCLPFADGYFDAVVIQAVLEHVLDPVCCVGEACRVLKPGGLVYAETPFMQQVHMGAYDFQRYTALGHRRLFGHFEEIDSGVACGTGSALCWSLIYFLQSFTSKRKVKTILHMLGRLLFFPLKYCDYLTHTTRGSVDGASGFYFLGKKSETVLPDAALLQAYRGLS